MQRVRIRNLEGKITHGAELEDPTEWINRQIELGSWGRKRREVWKDIVPEHELSLIESEREVEIKPAIPAIDPVIKRRYLVSIDPDVYKFEEEMTEEEIASALSFEDIVIEEGKPEIPAETRTMATLKPDYTIEIEDMTLEIEAEETRRSQIKNLRQRVKQLANQDDLTAGELKEGVIKLIKAMLLNRELD
jgi:hypothetical protein